MSITGTNVPNLPNQPPVQTTTNSAPGAAPTAGQTVVPPPNTAFNQAPVPAMAHTGHVSFKMPNGWDRNSPSFDGKTANSLKRFLKQCNSIISQGGLTRAADKKERVLEYVDSDVQEQWESLDTYAAGTYEAWIKEIEALFPELEDWEKGSLDKLNRLCKQNRGITTSDLGQLRRFSKTFMVEAAKLLADPAAISNGKLVSMFEDCLDKSFADMVKLMRNHVSIMEKTNPALAVAAGIPGTAGATTGVRRRSDKPPIQEVIKVADSIALSSGVDEDSDRDDFISSSLVSKTASAEVKGIKRELNSTVENITDEVAKLKDALAIQEKRFKESLNQVENSFKHTFSQTMKDPPPHMGMTAGPSRINPSGPMPMPSGPLRNDKDNGCHYCWETDHRIANCDYKSEHIDIGYLSFDSGFMRLGNGAYIPRAPMDKSRKVRVDEYYASQGKPKGKPLRSSLVANYSHQQYTQTGYGDDDYVQSVYDSRDDEIRAHRVQRQLMAVQQPAPPMHASYNPYTVPQAPGVSYSVNQGTAPLAYPGMNYPGLPSTPPASQAPQNQFVQLPAAQGAASGNMDFTQLVQLVDDIRKAGLIPQGVTQEQFVATRTGARSDGPARPNF